MGRQKTISDDEVLRIARDLFRARGHTATTREIAEAVGVSEAVLYQRFGSKDELFFAAMVPQPPDVEQLLGPKDPPEDAHAYLRAVSGRDFTAKDFRTWAGTVRAAYALNAFEPFSSLRQAKRNLKRAVESVATRLGNTPAICRRCYIHPVVVDAYLGGALPGALGGRDSRPRTGGLNPHEHSVLGMLVVNTDAAARSAPRLAS